ncbi:MAG TPA: hypothetical protein VMU36_08300 [Spirochaetia bacterium]|nr:hypothetical protein [Spirochaetia bacterium]
MKKLLIVLILALVAGALFAQTIPNFAAFQGAIQNFANGAASALPLESSVGLNWSDAYIGQFPHLGIGLTVGAATIPYSAMQNTISTFGGTIPSNLSFLSKIGIPVPAYTLEVRIGGFILPFDVGLKFGYLPPNAFSAFSNVSVDYLVLGGDVRYALVQDKGFLPGISVGVGYTYMRGNVLIPGVLNGNISIGSVGPYTLYFTNPSLNFFWNTNVIDARIQVSKSLFIITPYIGLGMSYGISNAGGGMQSQMYVNSPGNVPSQSQIDQINSLLGTNYTNANQSLTANAGANGFATRAFGGLSFNLTILKIGLGAEYEFLSGSFAGMLNFRIQL